MKANDIILIDCLIAQPGLNLTQLVQRCQIPQTTVHRTLVGLCREKLLLKLGEGYFLGPVLLRWLNSSSVGRSERYVEIIHPYLLELGQATGETIHLVQRQDFIAFYIDKVASSGPISLNSKIGNKLHLYCTGAGRALLTLLSAAEEREYWRQVKLEAFTPKTQIDKYILQREIVTFRQQGYAVEIEQDQLTVQCLGAALDLGRVQLAISITTTILCTPSEFLQFADLLLQTLQKIKSELQL